MRHSHGEQEPLRSAVKLGLWDFYFYFFKSGFVSLVDLLFVLSVLSLFDVFPFFSALFVCVFLSRRSIVFDSL